jgi:hypothetical protein
MPSWSQQSSVQNYVVVCVMLCTSPVGICGECYENGHTHFSRFEQCHIWLYCALYMNRSQVHAAAKHRVHVLIRLTCTYHVPCTSTR